MSGIQVSFGGTVVKGPHIKMKGNGEEYTKIGAQISGIPVRVTYWGKPLWNTGGRTQPESNIIVWRSSPQSSIAALELKPSLVVYKSKPARVR